MAQVRHPHVKIIRRLIRSPFVLLLGDDNIVRILTEDSAWITIKEARRLVEALSEFTRGDPHLILKIPGRHSVSDKEARSYIASAEGMQYSIAEAIVAGNMGHRIMGNILLNIDNPPKPIRVFSGEEEAVAWLMRHKT